MRKYIRQRDQNLDSGACGIREVLVWRERRRNMKKISLILGIVFFAAALLGTGYVLLNRDKADAIYFLPPLLASFVCFSYYQERK